MDNKTLSEISFDRIDSIISLKESLNNETDRGFCLLAVSFLENELKLLLFNKLVGVAKSKDSLFQMNGPLGTFSSKLLMCYSIGFISEQLKRDIDLIRKIRNEFGHSYSPIDFDTPKIKDWVFKLNYCIYGIEDDITIRDRFNNAVTLILAELHLIMDKKAPFEEKKNSKFANDPSFKATVLNFTEVYHSAGKR